MKDEKIVISKGLADYMEGVIKEYYGNITCFSKLMKLKETDLQLCFTEHKISVKMLASLNEELKLSQYDDNMVIDNMQLLKQKIKETGKSVHDFEDELGYEYGTITRAINRKSISPTLTGDICSTIKNWNPISHNSKVNLMAQYGVDFNKLESCEPILRVFKEVIIKFTREQLIFLNKNIELFCYFDSHDWTLLHLIQKVNEKQRLVIEEFIESHTIVKDSWKLSQCKSIKNFNIAEADDTLIKKSQYIDNIANTIEKNFSNLGLRYIKINLLLQMVPYIFYLSESDWNIIGKYSLLENWDDRNNLFKYKDWTINYVRGLI